MKLFLIRTRKKIHWIAVLSMFFISICEQLEMILAGNFIREMVLLQFSRLLIKLISCTYPKIEYDIII